MNNMLDMSREIIIGIVDILNNPVIRATIMSGIITGLSVKRVLCL